MPTKQLKEFLDKHNVKYVATTHSPAFTAQDIAEVSGISGRDLAKTVIVRIDGKLMMAVLPASEKISFTALKEACDADVVDLPGEQEFAARFPECEVGAMPPFGNLYGIDVIVAESLTHDKEIWFNAGTHRELIKMAYEDFARLVKPTVIRFSVEPAY